MINIIKNCFPGGIPNHPINIMAERILRIINGHEIREQVNVNVYINIANTTNIMLKQVEFK